MAELAIKRYLAGSALVYLSRASRTVALSAAAIWICIGQAIEYLDTIFAASRPGFDLERVAVHLVILKMARLVE